MRSSARPTPHPPACHRPARWSSIPALAAGLVLVAASGTAAELVIHVDRTDDLGFVAACDDLVPDDCTLRGAINLANVQPPATDVYIELEAATYVLTLNGAGDDANATGDLDVLRDMTIHGEGREATVISAGEMAPIDDRLVEVHGPDHEVFFHGLSFAHAAPASGLHSVFVAGTNTVFFSDCGFYSNGDQASGGGGLRLGYGVNQAFVSGSHFIQNQSGTSGAAISSGAHELVISSSYLGQNLAMDDGGAILLESPGPSSGETTIIASILELNEADRGGAVAAFTDANVTILRSTLRNNDATANGLSAGGGVYSAGHVTVVGSTFYGNQAALGGSAIFSNFFAQPRPVVDLFNSTFSHNSGWAPSIAALHFQGSAAELLHVTLAENSLDISSDMAEELALGNSLLQAGCSLVLGTFVSNGGNLAVDNSCWGPAPGAGDTEVADFQLGPLAFNGGPAWTHLPGPGSPALGAAPVCPTQDQRSLPRPAVDCASGSVERQANEVVIFSDGFESGDVTNWSDVDP